MLIPSADIKALQKNASLSRRVNANSQPDGIGELFRLKLIKKGEC